MYDGTLGQDSHCSELCMMGRWGRIHTAQNYVWCDVGAGFTLLRTMYDGKLGQDSHCSEQEMFKVISETVMSICATNHVATLLSDWEPVRFTTSSLLHEVTYSFRNVCLSTCEEWRTAEAFVMAVLLYFVHKLVLVTTKDSAPLLLAVQTLQFQCG